MIQSLRENTQRLLRPEAVVIVAVSGGADSVALLAGLVELGYNCVAAHCNFHLRGEESNRDMRNVQDLCGRLGIDLYVKDFDVEARRCSTGESLEMACRALRYEWFGVLLDRLRAQAIAVAHHREDNVETFFLNLMRGSSLAGLTGMRMRNGNIVRPLLDVSRAQIEAYLQSRDIPFVNDSTNAESVFARNRLRNIILPAIEKEFPGAVDGILTSLALLTTNREFYDRAVAEKTSLYFSGNSIRLNELVTECPEHRLLLFEMLKPLGFNITHIDNILAAANHPGATFTAGNTRLEMGRGILHVTGRNDLRHDGETRVSLLHDIAEPLRIAVESLPVTAFKPVRNPGIACFDESILAGNPVFTLRRWRRGDRITPFGMRGTKLLSDIFTDAKLTAADKRNVWVLTRNGSIIWVPGLKTTDLFTVTAETRRFLMLSLR